MSKSMYSSENLLLTSIHFAMSQHLSNPYLNYFVLKNIYLFRNINSFIFIINLTNYINFIIIIIMTLLIILIALNIKPLSTVFMIKLEQLYIVSNHPNHRRLRLSTSNLIPLFLLSSKQQRKIQRSWSTQMLQIHLQQSRHPP